MRLWSLHPQYLDAKGLVALWREALLAQAVLSKKTRGYTHHPQLLRFKVCKNPRSQIANYLRAVHCEAMRRGYNFDKNKLGRTGKMQKIYVTRGQLDYEWTHLKRKLRTRAPDSAKDLRSIERPKTHPLFRVIAGPVAAWEILPRPLITQLRVANLSLLLGLTASFQPNH
jgi:hypothetical protein